MTFREAAEELGRLLPGRRLSLSAYVMIESATALHEEGYTLIEHGHLGAIVRKLRAGTLPLLIQQAKAWAGAGTPGLSAAGVGL